MFFAVSIAVFRVSVVLPCIPITPISTEMEAWWLSALAFSAGGHGFVPSSRRGKILMSEHAFLTVTSSNATK